MTNPALQVVAAVIEDRGEILACRRSAGKDSAGKWEFPGGKVESGEDFETALRREIEEELGAQIRVVGQLTSDTTSVGDVGIELTCFLAVLVGNRPTASTDHDELVWLSRLRLPTLDWAAPDLPAVAILAGH